MSNLNKPVNVKQDALDELKRINLVILAAHHSLRDLADAWPDLHITAHHDLEEVIGDLASDITELYNDINPTCEGCLKPAKACTCF